MTFPWALVKKRAACNQLPAIKKTNKTKQMTMGDEGGSPRVPAVAFLFTAN